MTLTTSQVSSGESRSYDPFGILWRNSSSPFGRAAWTPLESLPRHEDSGLGEFFSGRGIWTPDMQIMILLFLPTKLSRQELLLRLWSGLGSIHIFT